MNDPKEIADKVMTGFYRSCLGKNPTFQDDKIAVAAALRELVNVLRVSHGAVMCYDILEICDELELL